jgi:hypothetical protein
VSKEAGKNIVEFDAFWTNFIFEPIVFYPIIRGF